MAGDVLIVGAGIAGLSAAGQLLARGVRVDVVERSAQPRAVGAGIMLHPNALHHLGGMAATVRRAATAVPHQLIFDRDGSVNRLDWTEVWPGGALPSAIRRQRLLECLVDQLPQGLVRCSTAPRAMRQQGDGVWVEFDTGARRYDLVIGADGIHSWVREFVSPDASPDYLGQVYLRTLVRRCPAIDFPEWRVWRGGGAFFGAMPLDENWFHVFVQFPTAAPGPGTTSAAAAELVDRATAVHADAGRLLAGIDLGPVLMRPAFGLTAPRLVRGRVALVGDAAHAVAPSTTQGGGLAIEDTAVLADEIGRHGTGVAALRAYESRRLPRVREFARRSRLHGTLLETVQSRPVGAAPRASGLAPWFRRLYEPLMPPA